LSDSKVRVEELLERMGRAAVPADDPQAERDQRARSVTAMNARLDGISESRRKGRRRLRVVALAAAALLGLGALAVSLRPLPPVTGAAGRVPVVRAVAGDVEIVHGAKRVRASSAEPSAFAPADEIHTTAGARASAELPSGAKVNIEERSLVRLSALSSGGEELDLARGRVEVRVPHLPRGATLAVKTPDARVSVRGTRFIVEVAERDAQSVTSVSVLDGSVWVEARGRTVVLERGARFSTGHEPQGDGESAPTGAPAPTPSAATPGSGVARNTPPPGALDPHEAESTLPFENKLYLDAMSALREGNTALAAERLHALLERYPRSPLAPNARLELERLRRGEKAPR
jgi:hypothetical protein